MKEQCSTLAGVGRLASESARLRDFKETQGVVRSASSCLKVKFDVASHVGDEIPKTGRGIAESVKEAC